MNKNKVKLIDGEFYEVDEITGDKWILVRKEKIDIISIINDYLIVIIVIIFAIIIILLGVFLPTQNDAKINSSSKNDIRVNIYLGCFTRYNLNNGLIEDRNGNKFYDTAYVWQSVWSCINEASLILIDQKTREVISEPTSLTLFMQCQDKKFFEYEFDQHYVRANLKCLVDSGVDIIYKENINNTKK